jgi:D-glycero-D-manno-heptose 1,7-bisphosphate phosphatase
MIDQTAVRCVVLDRDGTLIRHVPYLHNPAEVELLPTVIDGVRLLRAAGCILFLHTNQSGIGRGMFSLDDAVACNDAMLDQLGFGQSVFERICIAPEAPSAEPLYRKPSPRFGMEIMAAYACQPSAMCYIGDNLTDLRAATHLGCKGAGVDTGGHDLKTRSREDRLLRDYPIFDTFASAARYAIDD